MLYGKDIYSFCMHLVKEKESADDLYQDAFLEATKKIASIRYEDNPKSYLLSIVIRLWKNRVRKRAWRSRIAPQVAEEAMEESTAVSGSDMVEWVVKEEGAFVEGCRCSFGCVPDSAFALLYGESERGVHC